MSFRRVDRQFVLFAFVLAFLAPAALVARGDDDDKPKGKKPKIADIAKADFEVARRASEVSPDEYLANIAYLASDKLKGRGIGSEGIDQAADYIKNQFKSAGLKP